MSKIKSKIENSTCFNLQTANTSNVIVLLYLCPVYLACLKIPTPIFVNISRCPLINHCSGILLLQWYSPAAVIFSCCSALSVLSCGRTIFECYNKLILQRWGAINL